MRRWITLFASLSCLLFLATGCEVSVGDDKEEEPTTQTYLYTFDRDTEGWTGDFADYPEDREIYYELKFGFAYLPAPLDSRQGSIMLSGNNHSDDLFMYATKKIDDLEPNTLDRLDFRVTFASNAADGQAGVGGAPGEGVTVKVGPVPYEPQKMLDENGYFRMNIDKGGQSYGGKDMVLVGDFSNDTNHNVYALKTVRNDDPFEVRSNADGEIWLIVGTDSGYEGVTTIYYDEIEVTATSVIEEEA